MCLALMASAHAVPAAGEAPDAPPSSGAEQSKGKPQIQFTTLEHDFGKAKSGPNLNATFEFKNVGDAVLVIENVKGG